MTDPLAQWLNEMEPVSRDPDCYSEVYNDVLGALLDCVRAAMLASDEIQSQRTAWPGEVDTLADAIARLRRLAKGDA